MQSRAHPRLADLKSPLRLRWVIDPRPPALFLEAPVRLRPRRRFAGIFNPMGQSVLITPFRQPRHNAAVHARLHEGARRPLVPPHRPGPRQGGHAAGCRRRRGRSTKRLSLPHTEPGCASRKLSRSRSAMLVPSTCCCGSSRARAGKIGTPCCRRSCSNCCALGGERSGGSLVCEAFAAPLAPAAHPLVAKIRIG
jgi:hypothetical protein